MVRPGSPPPADAFAPSAPPPPPPPPSKRDKRRTMLADKLADMVASFADQRDSHYRAQLAALQADISLILKANPYANQPLDDGGGEAAELVAHIMGGSVPAAPSAGTDYVAGCGRQYARFVDAVNDALEERDYNLTMLWNRHQAARRDIENAHRYKVHIAAEEHRLLAATVRDRLLATLHQRTARLRREKEQLDLSDSNAMLLHPSHFSVANPQSPGGPHAPRKTRRTGHKFGDDELAPGTAAADNKRKRKLFDDPEPDNQGSHARTLDQPGASPFRDAKARTVHAQFEAPAYSLDRLFTEKELNMAMNQATMAASHFFATRKPAPHDAPPNGTPVPNNGTAATAAPNGITINGDAHPSASENGEVIDPDPDSDELPPGATDMARQTSSNPHATRGATRSALHPSAALANGQIPFIYNPPFILDAKIFQKLNASAPTPPPLSAQDVEQDLKLMLRDAAPDDELSEKLLQAAIHPVKAREYQVQPPGFVEPVPEMLGVLRGSGMSHLEVGGPGGATTLGGVAMSAQSSFAGYSDGGTATPRGLEKDGLAPSAVAMARTASGNARSRGRARAA